MSPGLMAALAAAAAVAAAGGLALSLRRVFYVRRLRIRLELEPLARSAGPAPGILGLADPYDLPELAQRRNTPPPEEGGSLGSGIEPPQFWIASRRAAGMVPALMVSAGIHAALIASAPGAFLWLSRAFDREAMLVVRVDGAIRMPLTLHAPDLRRVLFAQTAAAAQGGSGKKGRPAAQPVRRRALAEPAIPNPSRRVEELPAPPLPSAAAAIEAPRPERSYRVVPATTLLQPRRPVARQELVELPAFAAWAGRMPEMPLVQAPGSPLPGMAQAAPPPRAPVLPLRSGAPVRAELPRLEEPKLALPPPGIPADTPLLTGAMPGSGIPQSGEPISVISISPVPLRPGEAVSIPPVNQIGGGSGTPSRTGGEGPGAAPGETAGLPPGGEAASGDSRAGPGGSGKAQEAAIGAVTGTGPRDGAAGTGPAVRGGSGTGSGPAGGRSNAPGTGQGGMATASPGTGGRGAGGTGNSSRGSQQGSGTGRGPAGAAAPGPGVPHPNGMIPVRLGSQMVMMERRPEGAVVLHYPADGNFDVIVVESGLPDPLAGLTKRLSGKPVYTAYLNVGAEREWILHYCAAEQPQQAAAQGMVVTLEDPPPLKPPYVLRAELPAPEEWKSSQYQVFHGYITGQGKMERISAVRVARNPAALLKLLPYWEFRAAVRGRTPVEIEVMLVIPPERVP